ncbi:uncharacterized protein LOC112342475 [Selaginella moellendorffii]|nr:uncharacterized protein LOC112342475 [Selaginella moellendorffii]|eukprot:XP_024520142.1 uncharacterized protein LOC112342475 [Selaginella moellendorffii]
MGHSEKLEGDSGQGSQLWQLSPSPGVAASSPRSDSSTKSDEISNIRVKLMCSYGGKILPRPNDSQLRYMGGETRIVVVDRAITLRELLQKLRKLTGKSMLLKYQLPGEDLDALVSVKSDEDLDNMMEEYDRLMQRDPAARLRVFLFQQQSSGDNFGDHHSATGRSSDQQFIDALNGIGVPLVPAMRAARDNLGPGMDVAAAFQGVDASKLPESLDVDDEAAILFGNHEFHFTPVARSMSPQRLPPACIPLSSTPFVPDQASVTAVFRSPPEGSAISIARQQHFSEQQPRSGSRSPTRNSALLDDSPRSARAAMSPSRFRDSPLVHARQAVGSPAPAAVVNPVIAPGKGFAPVAHQHHVNQSYSSLYPFSDR